MLRQFIETRGNLIGIALLTLLILAIGWLETAQPNGQDFGDLTNGIITFNTVVRVGILTIVVVGLNLLMGYAGQASLGQAAFYGMGAYVSAILTTRATTLGVPEGIALSWWWPWLLIVAGMVLTGGFAYLVGKPILNLKGHYLGMATLGLGIMIFILFRENFGIQANTLNLTGGFDGLPDIPRLRIGSFVIWPLQRYYYLVWFFAILVITVALNIADSRVGRALRAIHGSEIAAETMGIDTADLKVKVFMLSTMFASLAGSLYAHFQAAISPTPFNFVASLELVVMAAVGGMSAVWGAPLGVAIILGIEELLRARLHLVFDGVGSEVEPVIFGTILVVIMIFLPDGLSRSLNKINWISGFARPTNKTRKSRQRSGILFPSPVTNQQPLLTIDNVAISFGGLRALNGVNTHVYPGQIKAIIGPNGAGKTTLFNIITGIYTPTQGQVRFNSENITGLKPNVVASKGIARTFQTLRLFPNMSVLENVMVGQHRHGQTGFLGAALRLARARLEERQIRNEAIRLLDLVGLADYAAEDATNLPFGLQRKLEIARALATRPALLMLDEPASGLNAAESQQLVELIRLIRAQGTTVILVEHDMAFVMELVDEVLVLVYGEVIADGPPRAIQENPAVIAAYLGTDG